MRAVRRWRLRNISVFARAHDALGDSRAAAADLAELAEQRPDDRAVALGTARALADCGRFADAELAYRRLLDRNAADADALLGLTGLFESLNRPGELATFFAAARAARADPAVVALGNVIASREAGKLAEALTALDAARGTLPEPSWQQMRGALSDSAGDADHAFAAFAAMNAADRAATTEAVEGVRLYRAELDAELAALDRPRPSSPPPEARPEPLFLLGFPRSGTTLIDTFLMGHGGVRVHEERPFLEAAARLGGSPSARAFLDPTQAAAMRAAYWHALDQESDRPDLLQVDKYPLASARAALIDALFPDAPILFMLRHPCDVVLSCFITRFRLNWGVAAFLSLDDTVAAYDRVMRVWIKAVSSTRSGSTKCAMKISSPTRHACFAESPASLESNLIRRCSTTLKPRARAATSQPQATPRSPGRFTTVRPGAGADTARSLARICRYSSRGATDSATRSTSEHPPLIEKSMRQVRQYVK